MRHKLELFGSLLCSFLFLSGTGAAADRVVFAQIDGAIDQAMSAMVARAVSVAEEEGAVLVLEIDSPGGAIESMDAIGRAIDRSSAKRVAWVRGNALSAAAYVALCGDAIYTAGRSEIGSAMPLLMIPGGGIIPLEGLPKDLAEKLLSEVRAKFRARAQAHSENRPGLDALAMAMVDPAVEVVLAEVGGEARPMTKTEFEDLKRQTSGPAVRFVRTIDEPGKLLNLTAHEAFDLGVSDGIVESRDELLQAIGSSGAETRVIRVSWSESFFGAIGDWAWLLWLGALVLAFIEFKTPGFGVAGVLALALVVLLLTRNSMIGLAELPEILLVVLGVVLVAIEIFVIPGFGVTGIVGLVCIAAGIVLSFLPFLSPETELEERLLESTLRNFLLTLVAAPFVSFAFFRLVVRRLPMFRSVVLAAPGAAPEGATAPAPDGHGVAAGDRGRAVSVLRPSGKVQVDGKLLDATSSGDYIERGESIEVIAVESNHVVVRRAATPPSGDAR